MSDVALLKKLRQSEGWLQKLCVGLLQESELAQPAKAGLKMRLVDGTLVSEPGKTGSQWRVHFSLRVPEWTCDHFRLTSHSGEGNGESLRHFPVRANDCLIADRGYGQAAGIGHVHQKGGFVIVRHNAQNLPIETEDGRAKDLRPWLNTLSQSGQLGSCRGFLRTEANQRMEVRLCAVRKSNEAIVATQRRLRARASRKAQRLKPETLDYAQWVIVLTTVAPDVLTDEQVLEWYRLRWQIELAFKRLKSLAELGHLPKYDDASSRAWLYGKLLVALLTERMQRHAGAFSPWGMRWLEPESSAQLLA
jgi:hypothetical protein